jgi:dolichyl-phosphate-mannose-protein mannosyltransferase
MSAAGGEHMYLQNTNPPLNHPIYLAIFACAFLFVLFGFYFTANRNHPGLSVKSSSEPRWFPMILIAAFVVRLIAAYSYKGFDNDIVSFSSWGITMLTKGPFEFYKIAGPDGYPPLYNIVLGIFTAVTSVFRLEYNTGAYFTVIKMPAILCDMAMGIFIYKAASGKLTHRIAIILSSLYLFNPAIIVNSSSWGQVDAVFTLAVVLTIYYITERKLYLSMPVFLIGLLMKPQTVIFTPILLLGVVWEIMQIIKEKKTRIKYGTDTEKLVQKNADLKIRRNIVSFIGCVITFFAFSIVFSIRMEGFSGSLTWLLKTYLIIISSYPYADLSAFNFFGLIGGQWAKDSEPIIRSIAWLTWKSAGNASIVVIVAATIWMYVKSKAKSTSLYLLAAFVVFGVCTFSSGVHERYVFPAMALILVSYIHYNDKSLLNIYIGLSALHFINIAAVLFVNNRPESYFTTRDVVFAAGSFLTVILFIWYAVMAFNLSQKDLSVTPTRKGKHQA